MLSGAPQEAGRPPREVRPGLWLFAPNRDTQGGSAWWLDGPGPEGAGGWLIDCPAYTEANLELLRRRGEGRILLTGDAAHEMPPTGGFGMNTGIKDAGGKGYTLKIGTLIGRRLGQVKNIRRGEVVVQEEFRDFTGKRIPQLKELRIDNEDSPPAQ